jgi:hypothetical protein
LEPVLHLAVHSMFWPAGHGVLRRLTMTSYRWPNKHWRSFNRTMLKLDCPLAVVFLRAYLRLAVSVVLRRCGINNSTVLSGNCQSLSSHNIRIEIVFIPTV